MKIFAFVILTVILFGTSFATLYAGEFDSIETQIRALDMSEMDQVTGGRGFSDLVVRAVNGQLDLSPRGILTWVADSFLREVIDLLSIMRGFFIIALLGAVFKVLCASFTQKAVAELGFYVNYLIAVSLLLSSFLICVDLMNGLIGTLSGIMEAAVPLMISVTVMAGSGVKAYALNPVILFGTTFISSFVKNFITPVIISAAVLQIVNYLMEKEMLQRLTLLIKNTVAWSLKITAIAFSSILALQGITAPIVNNLAARSAKFAINSVPVVGVAMSGAVDTVLFAAGSIRSGVMASVLVTVVTTCAFPLMKIAAFIFVYKLAAGVLQPVCDERIVGLIDSIGGFAALILGACTVVVGMFVFMVVVMLS